MFLKGLYHLQNLLDWSENVSSRPTMPFFSLVSHNFHATSLHMRLAWLRRPHCHISVCRVKDRAISLPWSVTVSAAPLRTSCAPIRAPLSVPRGMFIWQPANTPDLPLTAHWHMTVVLPSPAERPGFHRLHGPHIFGDGGSTSREKKGVVLLAKAWL